MWTADMTQASRSDLFQELYSATVAAILESSCFAEDQTCRALGCSCFAPFRSREYSSSFRGASKVLVAFQLPTDKPVAKS